MNSKILNFIAVICLTLALTAPTLAQEPGEKPVAVISLAWGVVTVKHTDADYKPARWLEPIYVGDEIKTNGPGSKLLITYFYDNHQEVLGEDLVAEAKEGNLVKLYGESQIRRDKPRNPFGAGGVENPFIYTHQLVEDDFKGAYADGAFEAEMATLRARVRATFPPAFYWDNAGEPSYELNIYEPSGELRWSKKVKRNQYKLTRNEANKFLKGVNYKWGVTADGQFIVKPYEFKLLTLPLKKWFDEQASTFNKMRKKGKLQRSNYTDYLLVCSQISDIDRSMELIEKMRNLDPKNPRVFRALTRIYLLKGCPAHALAAHKKLKQLGGLDPIYP